MSSTELLERKITELLEKDFNSFKQVMEEVLSKPEEVDVKKLGMIYYYLSVMRLEIMRLIDIKKQNIR
jgi:hypothetical protein